MRVALIAHNLRGGGGISVGRNLISALTRVAPNNQYLVTIPKSLGYDSVIHGLTKDRVHTFPTQWPIIDRLLYENTRLIPDIVEFQPDIILNLGGVALGRINVPQVILCHNSHLWYPYKHFGRTYTFYDSLRYMLLKIKLRYDLKRIRLLMCQTRSAERRIRDHLGFSGPVHICPNAVSRFTLSTEQEESAPAVFNKLWRKKKLFYLTAYYPHKNLEILTELFSRHPKELSEHVVIITISEAQHPGADRFLRKIKELNLNDKIINVGPLPQEELAGYFRNCDALLMPTLLESFSGTYLEAMHFRLPILTSDLDFAREICDDAAIYFDPWSPSSIVDAIYRLEEQSDLAAHGTAQLERLSLSWDQIANSALNMIEDICLGRSRTKVPG